MSLEIICAQHRAFPMVQAQEVLNIQAGKALHDHDLGIPGDDTGENISTLNPFFSEMTAVYWYWKNRPIADAVGVCHYRRFFDPLGRRFSARWRREEAPPSAPVGEFATHRATSPASFERLAKDMTRHPLVTARPLTMSMDLEKHFVIHHSEDYWRTLMAVLSDHGEGSAARFFQGQRHMYLWNMAVMRKDVFEDYAAWLFPILFDFHERANYPADDAYQRRAPGFVAERMLNLFLHRRGITPGLSPVVYFTED